MAVTDRGYVWNPFATGEDPCATACHKILLVGHSLGGSIAVRVAAAAEDFKRRCRGAAEIAGVVAVDVVGGTALAALEDMPEVCVGVWFINIVINASHRA